MNPDEPDLDDLTDAEIAAIALMQQECPSVPMVGEVEHMPVRTKEQTLQMIGDALGAAIKTKLEG